MSLQIELIRQTHRLLRQRADIEGQLERGPKQVKAAQLQVDAANDALNSTREQIKQKRMEADRKQLQLREREQRVVHMESQLNAAKGNREYQTLKEQIAAERQANSVLSDEILEALESVDSISANVDGLVTKLAACELEKKKVADSVQQRLDVLSSELKRVQEELASSISQLSGDFVAELKRQISSRAEEAMAELDGNSCGGCYTNLNAQILDRLQMNYPINCPSCGRIIYSPENRRG
jgi:predicted  nucleic acid-binding Zn-ribbon protein